MISHYLTIVPLPDPAPEGAQFRQSQSGPFHALAIENLKFDNGSWFHKGRLMSFDVESRRGGPTTFIYHPSASDLGELFDTAFHSAIDFAVFAANLGLIRANIKGISALKNPTQLERISSNVKSGYRVGAAVRASNEGEQALFEHIDHLIHPSVFAEEGYYDSQHRLRHRGSIHRSDVYYGEFPPRGGRGTKMDQH